MKTSPFVAYVFFLLLAIFWSFSFLAIRISIDFFSPIFSTLLRVGVAFSVLTLFFFIVKTPLKLPWKTACLLWLQGIIGQSIPFLFLFWGEQSIAPGLASILNSTVPLWVLAINGLILREKGAFTIRKTVGLLLGFFGVMLIFSPMMTLTSENMNDMAVLGILSITIAAISYAIGAIFYQKLCAKTTLPFKASVWHQHIGSIVFLLFFSFFSHSWPSTQIFSMFSLDAWMAILYLGLFSTAFAYLMYSYLINEWGAMRAVSVLYVVPVFSVVWDSMFLHIHVHFYEVLGMLIILLGVFFVQQPSKIKKKTIRFFTFSRKLAPRILDENAVSSANVLQNN